MRLKVLSALALALGASMGQAQLVIGTTGATAGLPTAMYLDVTTGSVTGLYNYSTNKKANGIAATRNGQVYSIDSARLNVWNDKAFGVAPTFIAGTYRTNGTTTSATGFDDLAWANNKLYGWTAFPSTTFSHGIYQINTTPDASNHCIASAVWTDSTAAYTFQGLTYNSTNGLFYGTNTADNTSTGGTITRGLYSIDAFGSGTVTKIASFPNGRTGIDGLARADNGILWMTEKDRNADAMYVYSYDPVAGSYGTSYTIPYTAVSSSGSQALASGATWDPGAVPEPASFLTIGLGVLGIAKRRKR